MSTRPAYDHMIQNVRDDVVSMASMVDKAIARAIDALRTQDVALARQVKDGDKSINAYRWRAEEHALMIIATQGPMAGDLRLVAAALQIFTDLERMGDHAAGIAKIVIQTADEPMLKPLVDIPRMAMEARSMLNDAITSFIELDEDRARKVAIRDDEIDILYDQVYRELLTYMMADPSTINRATRLLWAAHNIERIGDRVTNICERVVFTTSGEFVSMDGGRKKRQAERLAMESASGVSGLS
ncbi:MAG TPA: phosphate signaling complex protein PhoU [Thermomicrobiales bacterium]|nr:phosphate signaling complex protein PhoU [Thermomicrobiales bacterium]